MSGRNRLKKFLEDKKKADAEKAEDERLDQIYLLKQEKKGVANAVDSNIKAIKKAIEEREKYKNMPKVAKIQRRIKEESDSDEEIKPSKKTKKRGRPKKEYKEKNIMKARSDLEKKGDKYTIDTEMKVSKSLDKKSKRALKKSVENALKNELGDIKGKGGAFSSQITPEMEEIVKNEEFKRKFMPNKTIDKPPLTDVETDALDRRLRDRRMIKPREEWKDENIRLGEKAKKQTDDFIKAEIKRKKKIEKEFEDAEHKRLLGKGVKKIILDLDSSDDEKPKRKRGRPKKST